MSDASNPYRSPMTVELPKDEPLRTVQFAGRYSLEEGLAIALMAEAMRPKLRRLLPYTRCLLPFVFLPLTIVGMVGLDLFIHAGGILFCVMVLSSVALSVYSVAMELRTQHSNWKKQFAPQDTESTGIFEPFNGSISEQGLQVEQDDLKTLRPWDSYTHFRHRDDVILFWLNDHAEADAISRSQFESGEDWLRALRMANHHLPNRPRGAISRG